MEACAFEERHSRTELLQTLLTGLQQKHGLDAVVVADEDGLVIDATCSMDDAERIAALAPAMLLGELAPLSRHQAPTGARAIQVSEYQVCILALEGEETAVKACLDSAASVLRKVMSY